MSSARPRIAPQPADDRLVEFGGRSFARFSIEANVHCVPVDEVQERIEDELNRILREVTGGRVPSGFPPAPSEELAVLDCGFGKGAWIDDLLGEYEDAVIVTGIDTFLGRGNGDSEEEEHDNDDDTVAEQLKPIDTFLKKRWNLNASFRDDRSESRLLPDSFDLVNSRFLVDGLDAGRWESYVRELRILLRPQGWLQMVELELSVQSQRRPLREDSCLRRWWARYTAALALLGKNPRIGRDLERLMRWQGLEELSSTVHSIPIGAWDRDRSRGRDFRDNVMKPLVGSLSLWPLTGRIGGGEPLMDASEYRALVRGAERELDDDSLQLFVRAYVVHGRRPPDPDEEL